MTIDFKNINGGTVANQIGEPVVLTDGEAYPYTVDTIVSDVSYSRTIDTKNALKGVCLPYDVYYDAELAENVEFYTLLPKKTEWNQPSPVECKLTPIKVGTIIPANTPFGYETKEDNYTVTIHGDNRKGYVILKAGLGKPHYTDKSNHIVNTAEGNWRFFPVQEKITRGEFGQDFYTVTKTGGISRQTKDTSSVNSYRFLFCLD